MTLTVSPPTLVAKPNNDRTYPWLVEWTLVLRETAGLGGNVNYVNVGFVNSFGFETPSALKQGVADALDPSVGALYTFGFIDILEGITLVDSVPDAHKHRVARILSPQDRADALGFIHERRLRPR